MGLHLFVHLVFDGEAVAIPAGPVRAIEAGHLPALDDDVFEDLVEGVPQMDVAVGVRRAVVEDEPGASPALAAELGVEAGFGPALQHQRLPPGQVGLHGKIALGQVQGLFIIQRNGLQADGINILYPIIPENQAAVCAPGRKRIETVFGFRRQAKSLGNRCRVSTAHQSDRKHRNQKTGLPSLPAPLTAPGNFGYDKPCARS